MKTNWRTILEKYMKEKDESFKDIIHSVFVVEDNWKEEQLKMTDAELDREFDDGYGGAEGCSFTIWTETRVYFPVVYDGSEWISSVPRNPCDEATSHVGG